MIEPTGPLPPEIYWRRRLVAIGGVAVAVALIIGLIIWATGGNDNEPTNTAVAASPTSPAADTSETSVPPSSPDAAGAYGGYGGPAAAGAAGAAGASVPATGSAVVPGGAAAGQAPGPVPASGLCPDSNIGVVLYTDKPTYTTGDQPVFTIVTTNVGLTECTRDVGKAAQNVIVRTLDGTRTLWSARDCSPLQTVNNVTLQPAQQVRDTITWSGTTSNPGCDKPRVPIPVGSYQAIGKIGERESAPITFNVVAPAQQP